MFVCVTDADAQTCRLLTSCICVLRQQQCQLFLLVLYERKTYRIHIPGIHERSLASHFACNKVSCEIVRSSVSSKLIFASCVGYVSYPVGT